MKPVREYLSALRHDPSPWLEHAYNGLAKSTDSLQARVYTGKVRDVVRQDSSDELLIVHSDRLTAFDRLISMVPYKGSMLTAISDYWLTEAKKVVPTHLIACPQERVLRTQRTTPYKVEVVVRGYLAGSMQRAYAAGERVFCGAILPEGLQDFRPLPQAIITPTTKAAAFEHDENISPAELIERGVCTATEWEQINQMALRLFSHGQQVLATKGWILVDTKYEFGRNQAGDIIVIDEIHTPDCSRLWLSHSYEQRLAAQQAPEMLDKENVRRWLLAQGFQGHGDVPQVPHDVLLDLAEVYLNVTETLTGKTLMSSGPGQEAAIAKLVGTSCLG